MKFNRLGKTLGIILLAGSMTMLFSMDVSTRNELSKNWNYLESGNHDFNTYTVDNGTVWGASDVALWKLENENSFENLPRWNFMSQLHFKGHGTIPGSIIDMYPGKPFPYIYVSQHCPDCWSHELYHFNGFTWVSNFGIGGKYQDGGIYQIVDSTVYYDYAYGHSDPSPPQFFVKKYQIFPDSVSHDADTIFSIDSLVLLEFLVLNNKTPFMGYITKEQGSEKSSFRITKYNGSAWQTLGKIDFVKDFSRCKIAFDSAHTPYILVHKIDSNSSVITLMRFNEKEWEQVGKKTEIKNTGSEVDFQFLNNRPLISFVNADTTIAVQILDDSTWKDIYPSLQTINENYRSQILVSNNVLYVSYRREGNDRIVIEKYKETSSNQITKLGFKPRTLNVTANLTDNVLHISGKDITSHLAKLSNLQGKQIKIQKLPDGTYMIFEKLKTGLYFLAINGETVPLNYISH